jgi:hypothetical protein
MRSVFCGRLSLLIKWDRGDVALSDAEVAAAIDRYWQSVDAIARASPSGATARMAKTRVAYALCRGVQEASPRRFALLTSALADLVAADALPVRRAA